MQHIPHHSLDEIERSRQEMEAFRKERRVARQEEKVITAVYCQTCKKRLFSFDTYHICS